MLSIIASPSFWIDVFKGIAPIAFVLGLLIFIVVAPIHGSIGRLFGKRGNNALKVIFGVIAAFSIIMIVSGLIGMTS